MASRTSNLVARLVACCLIFEHALAGCGAPSSDGSDEEQNTGTPGGPPSPPDPPHGMHPPDQPIEKAALAGYMPGTGSVTPTGAYRYELPIDMPPGRAGVAPLLSLVYQSDRGNGIMGEGWALSGLSEIRRCRTSDFNGPPDGEFIGTDHYCLDGEPLVLVATDEFRTLHDPFARVRIIGNGTSWTVEQRDGRIRQYTPMGSVWKLASEADRAGNSIVYDYDDRTQGSTDETYLSGIDYSPGATIYGYRRHVAFTYEPRPDDVDECTDMPVEDTETSTPDCRKHTRMKQRLAQIATYASWDTSAPVSTYTLHYATSSGSGRSLLASVQKCGRLGGCLPAKQFTWTNTVGPKFVDLLTMQLDPLKRPTRGTSPLVADFDGNGRDAMIVANDDGVWLRRARTWTAGYYGPLGALSDGCEVPALEDLDMRWADAADLDGDGKAELIAPTADDDFAYYVIKFGASCGQVTRTALGEDSTAYHTVVHFGDVDGDGLPDMVKRSDHETYQIWTWRRNLGGLTFAADATMFDSLDHSIADVVDPPLSVRDSWGLETLYLAMGGAVGDQEPLLGIGPAYTNMPDATVKKLWLASGQHPRLTAPVDLDGNGAPEVMSLNPDNLKVCSGGDCLTLDIGTAPGAATDARDWQLRVADLDGDRRQELIAVWAPAVDNVYSKVVIVRRKTDGTLEQVDPGVPPPDAIGDFDGDGLLDFVDWSDGSPHLRVGQAATLDLIASVSDDNARVPAEKIRYWTIWDSNKLVNTSCAYPQVCVTSGSWVVEERDVHGGDAAVHGTAQDEYTHTYFNYSDPRYDRRTRRPLGFGKVAQFTPDRPSETITTYDLDDATNGAWELALHPIEVRTVVPILTTDPGPTQIASARARVSRTTYSYEVRKLYGGKAVAVLPQRWHSDEWEESVSIDAWCCDLPTDLASHIIGVDGPAGQTILRARDGSTTFDNFGNSTYSMVSTQGGVYELRTATYSNDTTHWLIGQLTSEAITVANGGTSPAPRTRTYVYDNRGLLTQINVQPGGSTEVTETITLARDAGDGQISSVTGTAPNTPPRATHTEYEPTERVYPSQVWNDFGHSVWAQFDPGLGVPTVMMDSNGVETTWHHDDLGRQTEVAPAGRAKVDISYAARLRGNETVGTVETTTDTAGAKAIVERDELGRVVKSSTLGLSGAFDVATTRYDLLGRELAQTRPGEGAASTAETDLVFDSLDRPVDEIRPDGTTVHHDQSFATTVTTDAGGHLTKVVRDVDERMVASGQKLGGTWLTTGYTYGAYNQLIAVTDPQQHVMQRAYDGRGRLRQVIDPDAGTSVYHHNGLGDLTSETIGGETATYDYDLIGRVTAVHDPDGDTTFGWDTALHGMGRLASTLSADGISRSYGYDTDGRAVSDRWTIDNQSYTFYRSYDTAGRMTMLIYPIVVGVPSVAIKYHYAGNGELDEIDDPSTNKSYWHIDERAPDGTLRHATYGNGLGTVWDEDPVMGRVTSIRDGLVSSGTNGPAVPSPIFGFAYGYDADGEVSTRTDAVSGRGETFDHDDLHRLTHWHVKLGGTTRDTTYQYDALGNLTQVLLGNLVVETNNFGAKPHQLVSNASGSFFYDARGRQWQTPKRTVTYDFGDLPRTIVTSAGTTSFAYDASHARVKKTAPNGAVTLTLGGLYERRITTAGSKHIYYVTGDEGPIAQLTYDTQSSQSAVEYLHRDALGSIGAVSNSAGARTSAYYYEPFGGRTKVDGSAITSVSGDVTRGFVGNAEDDDLGLIDQRGRIYDPAQRRFLTPDPVVAWPLDGQSYHPYSYVRNHPLDTVDASGFDDGCIGLECAGGGGFSGGGWGGGGGFGGGGGGGGNGASTVYYAAFSAGGGGGGYIPKPPPAVYKAPVRLPNVSVPSGSNVGNTAAAAVLVTTSPAPVSAAEGEELAALLEGIDWERTRRILAAAAEEEQGDIAMASFDRFLEEQIAKRTAAEAAAAKAAAAEAAASRAVLARTALKVFIIDMMLNYSGDNPSPTQAAADACSKANINTLKQSEWGQELIQRYNEELASRDPQDWVDFGEFLYPHGPNTVNIGALRGSRGADFDAANLCAGYQFTPEGYTWHHHQRLGVMQLVRSDIHAEFPHHGGVSIWKALFDAINVAGY